MLFLRKTFVQDVCSGAAVLTTEEQIYFLATPEVYAHPDRRSWHARSSLPFLGYNLSVVYNPYFRVRVQFQSSRSSWTSNHLRSSLSYVHSVISLVGRKPANSGSQDTLCVPTDAVFIALDLLCICETRARDSPIRQKE